MWPLRRRSRFGMASFDAAFVVGSAAAGGLSGGAVFVARDPGDDPMYSIDPEIEASERAKLFDLIEELVLWENSNNPTVINKARLEIARSIASNKVADGELQDDTPLVANAPELPEEQAKYLPDPPPEYTLDAGRLGRDAGRITEEVLSHLAGLPGANANITLEIQVEIPDGVPENVVRTVMENCRTLKFST